MAAYAIIKGAILVMPFVTSRSTPPILLEIPPEVILLYGLIPLLFSRYFFQKQKKALAGQESISLLNAMDLETFSNTVVTRLSRCGFTVVPTQSNPCTSGGSIKVIKNGELHLLFMLQAEQVRSRHIQEYTNILFAEGIHKGIVVTTGITPLKGEICSGNMCLELIDGKTLLAFLGQTGHSPDDSASPETVSSAHRVRSMINARHPLCPFCQSNMAIHLGQRNGNLGKTYWKCARHPECQGLVTFKLDSSQPSP